MSVYKKVRFHSRHEHVLGAQNLFLGVVAFRLVSCGSSVHLFFEVLGVYGLDSELAGGDEVVSLGVSDADVGTIELHHVSIIVLVVRIDAKCMNPVLAVGHEAAEVHQLIWVLRGGVGVRVKDAYAVRFVIELPDRC